MIKRLLALRLRSAFLASLTGKDKRGNPGKISAGKIAGYTVLYAFLALIFLFAFFSFGMALGILLIPEGAADIYFGMFMAVSLTIIFFFSIFETKAELFDCKDNELLLSMPIPPSAIIISRIFTVLVYNYIIEAIVMLPVVVAYLINGGNLLGVLGSVPVFLGLPLLATSLASGVGYLVAVISKRMKHKTLISVILFVLFMAVYFVGYFALLGSSFGEEDTDNVDISTLIAVLKPFAAIGRVQLLSPLPLVIFLLICGVVSFLAYYIVNKNYIKIITNTKGVSKTVYVERSLEQRSGFHALVRKEFSKITTSSTYIMNAGTGVIFSAIIALFAAIKSSDLLLILRELSGDTGMPGYKLAAPVMISAIIFCSTTVLFSASALSLEGKNLWILKSLPVRGRDILLAKTVPHIVIGSAVNVVLGIVLAIVTGADALYFMFYILIPIAANVFFGFLGILLNVAKPKFDYTNEVQVIKQSFPVFIITVVGMILSMGLIVLSFVFALFELSMLYLVMMLVLFVGLSVALYFIIISSAARKLDKIQA